MIDGTMDSAQKQIKARWSEPLDLRQQYADEAVIQHVNDRVYVSLGQIQVPPMAPDDTASLEKIEIQPVARLVFTEAAFHKVAALFARVSEQLADQADKE